MLSFGLSSKSAKTISPSTDDVAVPKSTAAEATMATVNIPAGMLVGKKLNVRIHCTIANTLATIRTMRIKLGATTVGQFTLSTAPAGSVDFMLCDRGDNTQRAGWMGAQSATLSASTYTASIDTTAATTLTITGEIASVAGSETLTLEFYNVELIV